MEGGTEQDGARRNRWSRAGRGEAEQMEQSGAIRGKAMAGRKGKTQRDRSSQAR